MSGCEYFLDNTPFVPVWDIMYPISMVILVILYYQNDKIYFK
jgi:hypothetical protein